MAPSAVCAAERVMDGPCLGHCVLMVIVEGHLMVVRFQVFEREIAMLNDSADDDDIDGHDKSVIKATMVPVGCTCAPLSASVSCAGLA